MKNVIIGWMWRKLSNCKENKQPNTFFYHPLFGYDTVNWKHNMGKWFNENYLFLVAGLLGETHNILPNSLLKQTVSFFATDTTSLTMPYWKDSGRNPTQVNLGWIFILPLFKKVKYHLIYSFKLHCIQNFHIPFSFSLISSCDVDISEIQGNSGDMRLHGSFRLKNYIHK